MAVLTTKQRNRLKGSQFALPGRRYPINDRSHAQNALARVSQYGTPAEQAAVRKAVARKYGIKAALKRRHHKKGHHGRH